MPPVSHVSALQYFHSTQTAGAHVEPGEAECIVYSCMRIHWCRHEYAKKTSALTATLTLPTYAQVSDMLICSVLQNSGKVQATCHL